MESGVRQGCPASPGLYLIVALGLYRLLERRGLGIHTYNVGRDLHPVSLHSADGVDSVDYSDLYDDFNNGPRLYARGWLELDSLIPKAIVPATSLPNYFIAAVHAFAKARSETASDNVSDRQTESLSDYVSEYSE